MHFIRLSALLLSLISFTYAISSKSRDSRGVPSDIKYIKCETCAQVAEAATESVQKLDQKNLVELQVLDIVETVCNPSSPNGRWMRTIDLVERLGKLRLITQDGEQDCTRECRTIGLACTAVLDGYETELAEKLYALRKHGDIESSEVESWLCAKRKGVTGACNIKPQLLPKDREKGPEFQKKDQKQVDMDNLMEQMRQMNGGKDLNMNMFNKDQLNGGIPDVGDEDEDDEDEDYDDDEVSDLGNREGMDAQHGSPLDDTSLGDTASEAIEGMDIPNVGADPSKKLDTETGSDEL